MCEGYSPRKLVAQWISYKYHFVFICLICGVIYTYYVYHNKSNITPIFGVQSLYKPDPDVVWHKMGIYRIYPEPSVRSSGKQTWQIKLFQIMQRKYHWNDSQLTELQRLVTKTSIGFNHKVVSTHSALVNSLHNLPDVQMAESIDIVSFPIRIAEHSNVRRTFAQNNPTFELNNQYWKPMSTNESAKRLDCPKVDQKRRKRLHDALQHWILFAQTHHIWWSLAYGSLIGSMRDQNIIPYDSDMDILVLQSDEQKIRKLATARQNIVKRTFNLVTRPGPHCDTLPGERVNCRGKRVSSLQDTCSFCGPLARMFMEEGFYIDLYLVHLELHVNESGYPIKYGYRLESIENSQVFPLSILTPLRTCYMMGLQVSCPNQPDLFLKSVYGANWRQPHYLCNSLTD